jgi:predicted RNase H-like nuclease
MTVFIGLDLAWTPHHPSGVCILEHDGTGLRLRKLHCSTSSPDCFATMCASFGPDVVVGVDAPLVVEADRRAEAQLARVYGARHAGAYLATIPFLTRMNGLAGPRLAEELRLRGFSLDPAGLAAEARGRFAMEVFPHPAHIELFGLATALKYKKGAVATRKAQLASYQGHLRTLLGAEAPLVLADGRVEAVLAPAALDARGKALKALEDRLDALTCAFVAYHCWRHGPDGFRVFGCGEHGSIVVPQAVQQAPTSGPARTFP